MGRVSFKRTTVAHAKAVNAPQPFRLQLPEFRGVITHFCLPVWVPQLEKWQLIQGDTGVPLAKTKTLLGC